MKNTNNCQFDLATIGNNTGYGIKIIDSRDGYIGANIAFQTFKGDYNNDGLDDIFFTTPAGRTAPTVYTIYGNRSYTQSVIDLQNLTPDVGFGVVIDLSSNYEKCTDYSTIQHVDSGFDYNHDGIDDLYVSTYCRTPKATVGYVIFGRTEQFPIQLVYLSDLPSSYYELVDPNCISCQDINGDGFNDLLMIGSSSTTDYTVNGSATCSTNFKYILGQDLSVTLNFDFNSPCSDASSMAAARLGDVNGDNFADIAISYMYATVNLVHQTGITYVIYGSESPKSFLINDVKPSQGYTIYGYKISQFCGKNNNYIGDVNGDDINDISLSCGDGSAFIVYGQKGKQTGSINLNTINSKTGLFTNSSYGFSSPFGGLDSFTGQKISDFIYPGQFVGGYPIIFQGSHNYPSPFELNSTNSLNITNSEDGGFYAGGLNDIGDVNGDNITDTVISALRDTFQQNEAIYILFGNSSFFGCPEN